MGVFLGGKKSTKTDQKYDNFQQSSLAPTGCALGFHIYEFLSPKSPGSLFTDFFSSNFRKGGFRWEVMGVEKSPCFHPWKRNGGSGFGYQVGCNRTCQWVELPKTDTERCGGRWCVFGFHVNQIGKHMGPITSFGKPLFRKKAITLPETNVDIAAEKWWDRKTILSFLLGETVIFQRLLLLNFGREIDLWDTRGRQAFGGRPSMVLEERQRYSVDLLQEKKGVNKPPGM